MCVGEDLDTFGSCEEMLFVCTLFLYAFCMCAYVCSGLSGYLDCKCASACTCACV